MCCDPHPFINAIATPPPPVPPEPTDGSAPEQFSTVALAKSLGIAEVEADVLPDGKNRIVRQLRGEGRVVAMAGDGVNDAPALAEADVGIAMGTGTEAAIQSAGITLVKGDLAGIVRARALSRAK